MGEFGIFACIVSFPIVVCCDIIVNPNEDKRYSEHEKNSGTKSPVEFNSFLITGRSPLVLNKKGYFEFYFSQLSGFN
jgi:hypothetical protein